MALNKSRAEPCAFGICGCVSIETTLRCDAGEFEVKCAHNLMNLHGKNIIGGKPVAASDAKTFQGTAAATGEKLNPPFHKATPAQADEAVALATKAFEAYRRLPGEKIAEFLNRIAEEITKLGYELIQRTS